MKNSFLTTSHFVLVLLTACLFASCSTDVELNAPYKSTTVIFGLLDADANGDGVVSALDTQWVKINRTYLGDGDNTQFALVRDSSEYHDEDFISKKVAEIINGNIVAEWDLTSVTVSNKNVNGVFYGPEQTLYYFVPGDGLNEGSSYRLILDFAAKDDVSAETNLITTSQLQFIQPQIQTSPLMATGTPFNINYVENAKIRWNPAPGARAYDAVIRFHYTEITYTDATQTTVESTIAKSLDFKAGSVKVEDITSTSSLEVEYNGESFFTFIENSLTASDLIRREIGFFDGADTRCFDVLLSMGNDELNTYIEVNSPVSGLAQERPNYTNVNNGLGLFASRSTKKLLNLRLVASNAGGNPQLGNLHALCTGTHTIDLNFCDPNPGSQYACD